MLNQSFTYTCKCRYRLYSLKILEAEVLKLDKSDYAYTK